MRLVHRWRLSRIAITASSAMLVASSAFAQTVPMFEDMPSIEQLRSIMIPESQPSAGRTIVVPRPDGAARLTNVHQVAAEALLAPPPVAETALQISPPAAAASGTSAPATPSASASDAAAEAGVVAFRVNFGFNSATLPDTARPMIDMIAELMQEAPQLKLRVEGHTDAVGSVAYNVSLSERRALSVGECLIKQGVDPSRVILIGKGMVEPLAYNPYDPTNRRVQFVRLG